jgi:hypothetical protein
MSNFAVGIFNYNLAVFFFFFGLLGMSNAGIRILRMTWIFEHVPNDVIGRTGSVFNSFNVATRIALLSLFSLPLFVSEGIIYAFAIQAGLILIAIVCMLLYFKRISSYSAKCFP